MKLLVVAMPDSIHVARWLNGIRDLGWEVHLFPSLDGGACHPDLENVTVHHSFYVASHASGPNVIQKGIPLPAVPRIVDICNRVMNRFMPNRSVARLSRLVRKLKPDLVHSMEFQAGGYLTLAAKERFGASFPPWIATNWGSDISLFGRLKAHRKHIHQVLASSEYYSCECQRDTSLAREFGFQGKILPVFSNAGGFDLERVKGLRQAPTSSRKIIMLKGYQGWSGRALVGLRALERCSELLQGYEVVIYSSVPEVDLAAELFTEATGVPVRILPRKTAHEEILRHHGQARISIGLSISDGISTSLLEAMVMGSFPVQSWSSCGNEWITNGMTGALVPPEDPDVIESVLRQALNENDLVDQAANLNWQVALKRLDRSVINPQIVEFYQSVLRDQNKKDS